MPIQIEESTIPEVKIVRTTRFHDERGFFTETYKEVEYLEAGIPGFVQDNLSESSKGVIRGLHWQEAPFAQGKLVSCLRGSILDVAVDIRRDSETYGEHFAIELNDTNQTSLWIPAGFAHGFQSLQDKTLVHYKVTNYWNSDAERSINPLDENIGVKWNDIPTILSKKDRESSGFVKR
jgi:dTDP-4-dehydrorhamnose 3,5-epimerase